MTTIQLGEFEVSILTKQQQHCPRCNSLIAKESKLCRKCKAKTLAKIRWSKKHGKNDKHFLH